MMVPSRRCALQDNKIIILKSILFLVFFIMKYLEMREILLDHMKVMIERYDISLVILKAKNKENE